jgi:predicted dehydrogenase
MRIGVIGLGFMGTTHLKSWRQIPRAEVVAVCSDDPQKLTGDLSAIEGNLGDNTDQIFDFSNIGKYQRIDDLISDPAVEAVDICLPTNMHSSIAIQALRAGKHVLVEKPMALDGDAAQEMIDTAAAANRTLMVGQVLRFLPAYRVMAEEIRSGRLGAARSALFRRRCAAPFWSKWLGDPSVSGGGVFDLLIHDIDFVVHLLGMPDTVSATGHEDLAAGIDTIHATLLYKGGPDVLITGGWHHRKAYPFSMEYTVVADGGTFEFNSMRGNGVGLYTADGEMKEVEVSDENPFTAELRYFLDCVESGQKPAFCPPEESAASVRLARFLLKAREAGGEQLAAAAV